MHEFPWDDVPTSASLVDLNRAGTPLIEIVTEPDLALARTRRTTTSSRLRRLVRWVDASDGNMEEGSLRCDANVSVRPRGERRARDEGRDQEPELDRPREEGARARDRAAGGGRSPRAARSSRRRASCEPGTGATKPMRSKEEAMDYRYFPDPDLGTLEVDAAWRRGGAASLPELPERARRAARRPVRASRPPTPSSLCSSRPLADWYEAAVAAHPSNPKAIANWLLSELLGRMTDADRQAGRVPVSPGASRARSWPSSTTGRSRGRSRRSSSRTSIATGKAPADAREGEGARPDRPTRGRSARSSRRSLAANPQQVATYRGGKAATFGWFVGQVMKATAGKASPAVVNRLLKERLEARRLIEFYRVAKEYHGRRVLRDVTFQVEEGRVRLPDRPVGRGQDDAPEADLPRRAADRGADHRERDERRRRCRPSRVPALRRSMGIVFQDYKLLPSRTVFENVTYVLKFLGVPAAERRRRAYQTLRLVELHHRHVARSPRSSRAASSSASRSRAPS